MGSSRREQQRWDHSGEEGAEEEEEEEDEEEEDEEDEDEDDDIELSASVLVPVLVRNGIDGGDRCAFRVLSPKVPRVREVRISSPWSSSDEPVTSSQDWV